MFDKIKAWYEAGLWNEKRVRDAVEKGKITHEQFKAITGKSYIS